jgi:DNA-directed RNA polymerase specialized sigma24 family protein
MEEEMLNWARWATSTDNFLRTRCQSAEKNWVPPKVFDDSAMQNPHIPVDDNRAFEVEKALALLPIRQRSALVMWYGHHKSEYEIARRCGIHRSEFDSHMCGALNMLREKLRRTVFRPGQ